MTRNNRAVRVLFWVVPIFFCLLLYWRGIRIWFVQDDFAWLNLRNHVTGFRSFLWAMFTPLAQGSIRPLSERAFFMAFSYFFGLRALPYRLFVFANQSVNIVLLMLVTRKLTKSDLAAFTAPLLWVANAAVLTPMAWTSSYNEVLCATFILASFYLFILYTETDDRRFYWGQWVSFALGFGALELNVVYPAIAALYALLFARQYFKSALPLFGLSAIYTLVHRLASPHATNFYYDMSFRPDAVMRTLAQYWNILIGAVPFAEFNGWPRWAGQLELLVISGALLGFAVWKAGKRQFLPLFLLCFFLILMTPLLPLHNHVTDYYLFTGSMGIAMLGAYALSSARQRGMAAAIAAAALVLLYLVPAAIMSHRGILAYFDRADRARAIVQSVAYAKKIHPGKAILLREIDDDMFWAVIYDSPFRIFGWYDVFVTPECRAQVHEDSNLGNVDPYFLAAAAVRGALDEGTAVAYAVEGRHLRNVTSSYRVFLDSQPAPPLSPSVDVGTPYFKDQLGEGWYSLETGFRWSMQHAVVYLPGPAAAGQKLLVHGYAPQDQVKKKPFEFSLTIDGRPQPVKTISTSNVEFRFTYDLPGDLVGKPKIEVAFTLDRTFRIPTDTRDFGLTFGEFTIR